VKALFAAMAKAFPKIEGAIKDNENAAFKNGGRVSKYADLSSVVNAIKPALVEHGLFYVQMTHEQEGGVCIETVVCHESGEQWSFGKLFVPASKQDAQGYGSALTYARRYSLMTAFGVCPEDDDGNAASKPAPQRQEPVSDRISDDQRITLQTLTQQAGTDLKALCTYYRIESLPELPATAYDALVKKLKDDVAKKRPQLAEAA
jgi:hypothetical protein